MNNRELAVLFVASLMLVALVTFVWTAEWLLPEDDRIDEPVLVIIKKAVAENAPD